MNGCVSNIVNIKYDFISFFFFRGANNANRKKKVAIFPLCTFNVRTMYFSGAFGIGFEFQEKYVHVNSYVLLSLYRCSHLLAFHPLFGYIYSIQLFSSVLLDFYCVHFTKSHVHCTTHSMYVADKHTRTPNSHHFVLNKTGTTFATTI